MLNSAYDEKYQSDKELRLTVATTFKIKHREVKKKVNVNGWMARWEKAASF